MTREEFIAKFRHKIDGWILEGCMENRRGEALSMWLRQMRAGIEVELGNMWDALLKGKDDGQGNETKGAGPGTSSNGTHRSPAVGVGGGRPAPSH